MTKIVAFAGKKQAGKNTAANFLFGLEMWSILDENDQPLIDKFRIDPKGRLIIPVDFGPEKGVQDGIFEPTSREPAVQMYLSQYVWPTVKMYSFADSLKEVCQNVLGLTPEQIYGNNEQKNTPSKIIWKNVPGFPKTKSVDAVKKMGFVLEEGWSPDSYMTARHVMQFVGTDIFRKMYENVWVDATLRRIEADSPSIAIITDCRFPNEVEGTQGAGGVVVYLTRAPFAGQDEHSSETALDADNYDQTKFNAILDNREMDIEQQNAALFNILRELEIIKPTE